MGRGWEVVGRGWDGAKVSAYFSGLRHFSCASACFTRTASSSLLLSKCCFRAACERFEMSSHSRPSLISLSVYWLRAALYSSPARHSRSIFSERVQFTPVLDMELFNDILLWSDGEPLLGR